MTKKKFFVCYLYSGDKMKKVFFALILMIGIGSILIVNGPRVVYEDKNEEKRSIFISYIELSKYLNGKNVDEGKKNIDSIINNVKELGFNEVIVQVRSFADAIYPSDIFPWSACISNEEGVSPGYDVFEYFIDKAHSQDVRVIAWINPYRIRTSEGVSGISEKSPAYQYLNTDVVYINNGIYFNPSKEVVTELIVEGVKEIISKYEVDGILFDDYFYPDNEIDNDDYKKYLENNEYISKEQYNLNVISNMVKEVYKVCKESGVKFGVSPDGNIDNNYNKVFADVKKWCSEDGYIDFIMPQVYYGFYNETKAFKKVVDEWENIISNDNIELSIALAFYKIGEVDNYAKSGMYEWVNNNDIIMREIIISRNLNKYGGFALFRYDYIFNNDLYNEMTMVEIENMKKVLN